jgi:excisionase family DNA binding protein
MENMAILINSAEAAKLLNVSEKTLWNHTAPRGKCIPAVRLGKTVRYSRAALDSWVATQSSLPSGQPLEVSGR